MRPFCKLADPGGYVACSWNLSVDEPGRAYWVTFFKAHLGTILKQARISGESSDFDRRAADCQREFFARFDAFSADAISHGRVTILTLDEWRDGLLRKHGFFDAFAALKSRENAAALPLLPKVCRELDRLSGREQFEAMLLGVFAGNIFDMGAGVTAKAFLDGGPDFFITRGGLRPRPWLIDDFESLAARLLNGPPHRKCVFFIDNAGSDFILGAIPMMRWLALRGTEVILAANERPTLNDMTIHDVRAWWPRIIETEPSLADLPIRAISTGTGEPLIDLGQVSEELNAASMDADFVVLEGMGRGVESNLEAKFSCDALNIAMLKDEGVAQRHLGKVFDLVCRFR